MKKISKKLLALVLSLLMAISSVPFVAIAEDGAEVTFKTETTAAENVQIDENIMFDYYIEVDQKPYNGVVYDESENTYSVKDGFVSLPYNTVAKIKGLVDKQTYSIKRMEYDNPKYALIDETESSFGEIASANYYVTKNDGKRERITDDEYFAGIEGRTPDENGTVAYTTYKNSKGDEADSSELKELNALDIKRTQTTTTSYDLVEGTHYYIDGTLDEYTITYNIHKSYNETKVFGRVIGYTFKGNVDVATNYVFDEGTEIDFTDKEVSEYNPTKASARSACVSGVKNSMVRLAYRILEENVAPQSGRGIAVKEDPRAMLPADAMWSDASETLTYTTTVYAYEELERTDYVYEMEKLDANQSVTFSANFDLPPTGSFDIPFMLYDGTIPNACKDVEFTVYDEEGNELEANVDYSYKANDTKISILGTDYGFTVFNIADLPIGSYTISQTKGQDGYIMDTRMFSFEVNRRGQVVGENITTSSNLGGSKCALTNGTWSLITKYNVFRNETFTIDFKAIDQNNEPVGGGDFLLIQRSAFLELVKTIADTGIEIIGTIDINSLLEQLQKGDWSNVNIEMILDIILSIVNLDDFTLGQITIPALLLETATDWKGDVTDGQVSFGNSSNMLNMIGMLTNGGTMDASQLASLIEQYFGNYINGDMAKAIVQLANMTTGIKVNTGMPSGKYVLMQTGSAKGYDKTSLLYTFDIKADGTATANTGIAFPLLVDAINSIDGIDLDMEDFVINEDAFNNATNEIKDKFGDFTEYRKDFTDGVINAIKNAVGEEKIPDNIANRIKQEFDKNYENTGNLITAAQDTVNTINGMIIKDVNTDWTVLNTRYYTFIKSVVSNCKGAAIDGVTYNVTDENGNEIEIVDGFVKVPYGIYKLNINGLPSTYVPASTLVTQLEFDNYTKAYSFNAEYHNPVNANDAVAPTISKDGHEDNTVCADCGELVTAGKVIPAYGVNVTINNAYDSFGELNVAYGTKNYKFGQEVTLKANPYEDCKFVGYEINGKFISQDIEYTFNAYEDVEITPVFRDITEDQGKITVIFYDRYSNIVASYYNVDIETFQNAMKNSIPTAPTSPGYEFTGWSLNDAELKQLNKSSTIWANYKKQVTGFTITAPASVQLNLGKYQNGAVPFDAEVTAYAKGATAWKIDDVIVAYGETYKFYIGSDVAITPVFEAVTAKPSIAMVNKYQIANSHKVVYLATISIPNNCKFVARGFIYGKNLNEDELTVANVGNTGSNENAGVVKSTKTTNGILEQFGLTYGIKAMDASACARAYLTYVDSNNEVQTIYSDMVEYNY